MNLKPTAYECTYQGYVYKFGHYNVSDDMWLVARQSSNQNYVGLLQGPYEVLLYVNNALTWSSPPSASWFNDPVAAKYDTVELAFKDVQDLAEGNTPSVLVRNKGNSPTMTDPTAVDSSLNDRFETYDDYDDYDEDEDEDEDYDEENK